MSDQSVCTVIRSARIGRKLGFERAGARAGVAPAYWRRVELGLANPSMETLRRMAGAVGLSHLEKAFSRPSAPDLCPGVVHRRELNEQPSTTKQHVIPRPAAGEAPLMSTAVRDRPGPSRSRTSSPGAVNLSAGAALGDPNYGKASE